MWRRKRRIREGQGRWKALAKGREGAEGREGEEERRPISREVMAN